MNLKDVETLLRSGDAFRREWINPYRRLEMYFDTEGGIFRHRLPDDGSDIVLSRLDTVTMELFDRGEEGPYLLFSYALPGPHEGKVDSLRTLIDPARAVYRPSLGVDRLSAPTPVRVASGGRDALYLHMRGFW